MDILSWRNDPGYVVLVPHDNQCQNPISSFVVLVETPNNRTLAPIGVANRAFAPIIGQRDAAAKSPRSISHDTANPAIKPQNAAPMLSSE